MSFLQPIWLYAIGAIIIPIAIHFWNIKEGKAFSVGSIALLEKSAKKYARTLRINEWLLLILRCLLIILLAMLLAKPLRQQKLNKQGWILLNKQNTKLVYNHFKPVIDSLLNKGFELHNFDESLKKTDLKGALASEDTSNQTIQYWPLIKKADNKLPASFPVYVFTTNRLRNFRGERPQVNANIKWFAYSTDTTVQQIAKAWKVDDNHIRVLLANSAATGNIFSYEDVPVQQNTGSVYKINSANGRQYIAFENQQPVIVDTSVLRICIYANTSKTGVAYIKAALDAIRNFTKLCIQVNEYSNTASIPPKNDWLFWLSDAALPKNIVANNVFKYQYGKETTVNSIIKFNDISEQQAIAINKIITADATTNATTILWKDGFGNPLLTRNNTGGITVFNFYSRFNPQWNNLVWDEVFPSILLHLIFSDAVNNINNSYADERTIDTQQLQPALISSPNKKTVLATQSLSNIIWLALLILFCAERVLSFKIKTTV